MTQTEVIALIQAWIIANGNEEITADVLRPILEAMVNQPNELIGDLGNLNTSYQDDLVGAINEINALIDGSGLVIYTGSDLPDVHSFPTVLTPADFYVQLDGSTVLGMWAYNGNEWIAQIPQRTKTVKKFVSLVGITTAGKSQVQWMADAINLNISNGAVYECEDGDVIDFFVNISTSIVVDAASIRRIYTRLCTGATSVTSVVANDLMPDGSEDIPVTGDLIVELGDIGTADVWTAFNADPSQPFAMTDEKFVSAVQNSEPKLWQWIGGTGSFGSTGTPAVEADFLDLTAQPVVVLGQNLQEVTDEGNETTNPIKIMDGSDFTSYEHSLIVNKVGVSFRLFPFPELGGTLTTEEANAYFEYTDIADLLANQANQTVIQKIVVIDASADTNITFPIGETKLQAYYQKLATDTGSIDDYRLVSAPYGNHTGSELTADQLAAIQGAAAPSASNVFATMADVGDSPIPVSKTGTLIDFTENALYNEITYLTTGNLTLDLTGAVKGIGVLVYCDSYIPTISGEDFLITSGILQSDRLNILSFYFDGTNLLLNIVNSQRLSPPVILLTSADGEITINWDIVLGADNYVIERDTNIGFTTPVEVYNGALLTYTDTLLINDTTYYYRAKTVGNGYLTSDWSATQSETPTTGVDATLLLHLDASNYSTVTTSNGSVTEWRDLTPNGNDVSEATKTPTHSEANNNVVFAGTHSSSSDVLSRVITGLRFQQSDDFTVLAKGLVFNGSSAGGTLAACLASTLNSHGWKINLATANDILYFTQTGATAQNFAQLPSAGFADSVPRDFIFINEGGVLKIYDSTNTNVGTNGTTTAGTVTYSSADFHIGCANPAADERPLNGSIQLIKIWNRVLDSTERASELA